MSAWFTRNRHLYPDDWDEIATRIKDAAAWRCEACDWPHGPGHILTVHHLDFVPGHCEPCNLVALCARDHLRAHALRPLPRTRDEAIGRLKRRHDLELGQLCLPLIIRV